MVSLGSGGAFNGVQPSGEHYILNRLPYARGLQYEQIFWVLRRAQVVREAVTGDSGNDVL